MTSDSGGEHPADSASGPSGCPRYRERTHYKVQSMESNGMFRTDLKMISLNCTLE
jgi:hypothetical protein